MCVCLCVCVYVCMFAFVCVRRGHLKRFSTDSDCEQNHYTSTVYRSENSTIRQVYSNAVRDRERHPAKSVKVGETAETNRV